ncbi:protein phosphatase 1 regulatory subunit 26 [Saccopteryx leptura]|uniref:protein phosphatase 1 regulatory subunit 26 n=1 Tax=Saccopteryx leptura TaxID=249018 RepID=UPI00339BC227
MFLMNAPPVLALQSTWEAFGPPGSCRFPGRCSEPEGADSAAVSARVQRIISTLQGDHAARGRRGRDTSPAARPASAACGLAAGFDSKLGEEEDATSFGPSGLDSDSDDSVDRDIEEAIQQYLKAKSGATQPTAAAAGDSPRQPEPPPGSTPAPPGTPKPAPGSAGEAPGSTSPGSVSSEDSFERSIQAEIEQFLSEKRQHGAPRCEASAERKRDPSDTLVGAALRSGKALAVKARRQDLAGACQDFVFRKPPRLGKATTTAQPRSLRSRVTTEPESSGGTKPAAPRPAAAAAATTSTGRVAEAQGKGGAKRNLGPGKRGQGARNAARAHEAADSSSSDDGIEEAIQLYQLEKRKEASADPPQKTPPGEEPPDPAAHGASHVPKGALPEAHRRTPGKRKPAASKAGDLGPAGLDPDRPSRPPKETKVPTPPGNTAAKNECVDQSSCRADTSAELMCAEAILDISKTILPAPGEGGDRPLSAHPLPGPPNQPAHLEGDGSSVDSDDSIEQEIRTFLALKAQSGSLLPRTDTCPQPAQSPQPSPGPHRPAGGPRAPVSKTLDLSLGCRRKHRGGGNAVWASTPKKMREVAKEGAPDADLGQGRASEVPGREGEARGQPFPCRTVCPGDEHVAPDTRDGLLASHGKAVAARSVGERESSEDKSSSLDSDEDLDSAIKDLLRSKRKVKKRSRDPRAVCRKRVRFSTAETRGPAQQSCFPRGWKDRGPHLLKSCLSKSKRDSREDPRGNPPGVFCSQAGRAQPGSPELAGAPLALRSGRGRAGEGRLFPSGTEPGHPHSSATSPSSASDDTSSVDSDDSIELEIRKFLAEKAKESVSGSEAQGGGPTLRPGGVPRTEPLCRKVAAAPGPVLQPGVCTRSQRGRGTPQPAAGPRGGPRAEQACPPSALSRGQLAPARSTTETVSPAQRRSLCPHRDQSPRGATPTAGDSTFRQLAMCAEAGTQAGSPGGALPTASRGRSSLTRSPGADRDGAPQAGLGLPWGNFAHQSRLQSTWALSSEGRETAAWTGVLGSEREKGPEGQAQGTPSLAMDPKKSLPFASFSPLLSTQLFHFGNSASWGAKPAGLFGPGLSLPLQGPSFSAFREAPASRGPVFGSSRLLMKKAGGRWPRRKAAAALSPHDSRDSGSDEDVLDLRFRRRVEGAEDREAWGSDASELSDTSVEDGGPVAKGKVLKL